MTKEKLENHISHLEEKVQILKKLVKDMYLNNDSDLEVEKIKKQKLRIKDEIERCRKTISTL